MKTSDLYDLKDTLTRDQILICFAGPFSHSIIEELGIAVKHYLEAEQVTKSSLMSVFSIFIEQSQNIKHYTERKAAEGKEDFFNGGIVVIGKEDGHYVVCSGNFVEEEDIKETVASIEQLKELDPQGLKAAYKEQMRKELQPGQGAGLGLIDMARKSSSPLQYTLKNTDDQRCFFSLKAII